MLDTYFSRKAESRDILSSEDFSPEAVILRQPIINPGGNTLSVLIPPWHGNSDGWPFDFLTKRLTKKGDAVLAYTFHDELLKPDVVQVLQSFKVVQKEVAHRLEELSNQYNRIHLIGTSLGCAALCLIAEAYPDFDAATLVVPGSNLAYCMWNGIRTQHIRTELEKSDKHWNYEDLNKVWQPIAPISHVAAFKDKPVTAYISTTDRVIPSDSQREIVGALSEAGADVTEHASRLGHLATIGKYCLV